MGNVKVHIAEHKTNRQYFLKNEDYDNREIELRGKKPWTRFRGKHDEIVKLLGLSENNPKIEIQGLEIIFVMDNTKRDVEIILLPYIIENPEPYVAEKINSDKTPCVPNERFVILIEEMKDYLRHLDIKKGETLEFYLGKDKGKNKVVMQIIGEKGEIVICNETNTPIELP